MAWSGLNLTVEGRKALNQAQLNNRLNFKSIVVGDGNPPSNFSTQKQLVHQLYELTELKIDITENKCVLTADFPNVDYDYYFREIGIIVTTENGDKLYVYDNCGDDAQYIVTTTGTERTEKRLRLILMISDVEHITVSESSILYVAYDEYEKTITELKQNKLDSEGGDISDTIVKFTESQQTENICSGEKLGIIFSKIQKALKDCFAHITSAHVTGVKGSAESIYRTGNVEITAEKVGLGNVDNTADSTKSVNYAASAGNAAKVNGHNVNADVPSDAKFTDTDTWRPLGTTADTACAGNDSRLSNARPASDVYAWAKASTKPAYNKAEVGLGNVDNTADSTKSVNYAASAGNAAKVNGHNVNADVPSDAKFTDTDTWRPLGTTADTACAGNDSRLSNARPASDVYAWAKASTKPAYNKAEVGLGNVDNTADSTKSVNYAASAGNAAKVNGHNVNADVPSDAKFTDTKGTCLSGRSSSYGWSVNRLPSDYLIEAFHTAAKDYSMTSPYGNMYWASFEITIPQSNNIKFFDAINITPFATSGLISVSITNYTTSKIQGFVFSPLAETKSISFHVTLHGTAS